MTRTARPPRGSPASRLAAGLAALALGAIIAACGGGAATSAPAAPSETASPAATVTPAPTATPAPSPTDAGDSSGPPGSPAAVASPVEGLLLDLDTEGLVRVRGFRLRTAEGTEVEFAMGVTENGVEFPPSHLAEHLATLSPVRVFWRDEGGERVVYRLEDAD